MSLIVLVSALGAMIGILSICNAWDLPIKGSRWLVDGIERGLGWLAIRIVATHQSLKAYRKHYKSCVDWDCEWDYQREEWRPTGLDRIALEAEWQEFIINRKG